MLRNVGPISLATKIASLTALATALGAEAVMFLT